MPAAETPRPPLDPQLLSGGPWPVEVVEEAGSTNQVLAERAREGAPEQVLVAEHQTAGRGRLDRSWETPARAALTFSVLLRPSLEPDAWPWLPLLTGYAVHAALVDRVPSLGLKWPNDVLVGSDTGDAKLAGILVERVETPTGPAAVLGIGINVHQAPSELPVPDATSLAQHVEATPDRTEVLGVVLSSLAALLPLLDDTESLRRAYAGECLTLGKQVRVVVPAADAVVGTAIDLDPTGRLVVETSAGQVMLGAGDVVHVRAADDDMI